jgi:hypothetical protein
MAIDAEHLYKEETGSFPVYEKVLEFEIWRSRGQWIMNITDEEKFKLWGNQGVIELTMQDQDYVDWLENKVMELLTQ